MAVAHKGSISMGMVLIPVGLYKTTIDNDIHFNQLEKKSKSRIIYKKFCSHCGKEVGKEDIIKGYEYEKNKYVVMTDEELEKVKTKKDKTIHILQFSKIEEVDMKYFEKDYYAIPETGAEKAYELLRRTLLEEKKVAIAKTVMGTSEKLLVLYPLEDGMIVKTLYYYDEIAAVPRQIPKMELDDRELTMAKMLVQNMTAPFEARDYQDEYQVRLREAISQKIRGQEIVSADSGKPDNVIDLMEALQKSIEQSKHGEKGKTGKKPRASAKSGSRQNKTSQAAAAENKASDKKTGQRKSGAKVRKTG